ncbi:protein-S-isoprenylcysteine O-methyltransferase [Sphingomonas rosea]|uniref:Protein-S-isoprenylcysteine O-methyltransferase n=1 Tax=Sphingomonas rosea TaxID=335605 RepID=A0ABP7U8A6_9SPHN
MMQLWRGVPTNAAALAVLFVGLAIGLIGIIRVSRGQDAEQQKGGEKAGSSKLGILVQALGFALASGPVAVTTGFSEGLAAPRTWLVLLLIGASLWLVLSAFRVMGEEWALVARTREAHRLVTNGPFALVRNPIYLGLLLYLGGMAVALGYERHLPFALVAFAVGTAIRVQAEERLLRARFGGAYDAYAARVKRIIPGLI